MPGSIAQRFKPEDIDDFLPVIRKVQVAGKGVIVDLQLDELEPFMSAIKPDGLFLCLAAEERLPAGIPKRLKQWR